MNNKSFFDRIPLPVLIAAWLIAVLLGVLLVFSQFFNTSSSITAQSAPTKVANVPPVTQIPQATSLAPKPTSPVPQATPTIPALQDPAFGYGIQADFLTGDPAYAMTQTARLRMGWIKQQLRWGVFSPAPDQFDWSGFDRVINAASAKGLKVMLSIVTAPQWSHPNLAATKDDPEAINGPPDDLTAYAKFVGTVVDRYPGQVHAIEIWNEQNIDAEWRTAPQVVSPEKYAEMLKLAYQTIKAKDPNIIVISGALAPTGYFVGGCTEAGCDDGPYLKRLVDAGFLPYVDCVGVHANGYNVPPDKTQADGYTDPAATFKGPFTNPIPSWYFRGTLELYRDTVQNQKPLCVTEFGWATNDGFGVVVPGYEFASDNTQQEQADWIVQAYTLMKQWGYVKLAFLFNLDYAQKSPNGANDRTADWSITGLDGSARPAFNALHDSMKAMSGQ
ncbi:MAG TPA: cellulase family glycosylhydrolase [Anaerolineae bacterium]|nr:cellulase family glycosylhydrolase [Anaerolineae bacterium]